VLPIQVADLHLSFRGRDRAPLPVLDGMQFDVVPGEFVSLLGPSGCGKSTLLHVVAGLLAPDAGSVRVGDDVIGPGSRIRPRGVGYVFQSPRLLNWLTVADNLAVVLEAAGLPRAKWDPLIDHYLDLVGLSAFKRHHPLELSGGMQHRVALVRALAIAPRVILMDEPLGALDAITARRVRDDLVRLCQESGATVLYVTHNIAEAVYLADRVLLLYARPTRVYRDVPIPVERPRHHGDPRLVALETAITDDFFANVMAGAGEL
jgi:NitT/TauT family transport system ATP-binding protein